ncbi:hypothetical protein HanXRQr2_Chr07g0288871 [Helianthus annuus]|uniref:Uncharacterized protein n=1 Tax=Helianthus annuus TaxID=4232 RepID=A0A251UBI2_HELAN|nr:hypothetical protein HanXRQr2_Chr07g0288871 [Helianthus annuus]KAJ0904232.1 hypothetical protein HanPSC8_Chr07g0279681 [Helianthus annuus]
MTQTPATKTYHTIIEGVNNHFGEDLKKKEPESIEKTLRIDGNSHVMSVMPSKRTIKIYSDMVNQMKVDGSYPAIVFSC